MHYADLYRQAVEAVEFKPKQGLTIKLLLDWVAKRRSAQRILNTLLHLYQWSGMRRVLEILPFSPLRGDLKQLDRLLPVPHVSQPIPHLSQAISAERSGEVVLFTGCVANIFDSLTHQATIKLLTHLGFDVRVLENQTCCGAMHAHNGQIERSKACARQNIEAFAESPASSIIYNSSGCGAFLSEYPDLLKEDASEIEPATDVMDFLNGTDRLGDLEFRELKAKVAVHEPCSQRNVLQNHGIIYDLLEKIPGLEVFPLPGNDICCGAGGTQMVTQPELAVPLRDEKVEALLNSEANLLISTNLTCAMHLSSGIRAAGGDIEVMHPVRLLAQQLV
jgi:glycolate oxidase iron-sulfur subunit